MIPNITLLDGTTIPQLGFGVFLVKPEETAEKVSQALSIGYRHIDTAQGYHNEAGVGEAVASSGLAREEVYLTTKLANSKHADDDVESSFEKSLEELRTDYVDLFLMHWPLPTQYGGDFVATWQAMIKLTEDGRARSIGVSNFEPDHLAAIIDATAVVPVVNQIEVHPYFRNEAARAASLKHGIFVEAWGPLGQGTLIGEPALDTIAQEVGKTGPQVALRWHIQRGDIIFPKSNDPDRMQSNFDIFDFELSDDQMVAIDELDKGDSGRVGPHPNVFDVLF